MNNPSRVRIKMCGMTRATDIEYATALGVDAIGLIFYQKSPRYVNIECAKGLLQRMPAFVDAVAVVVNPEAAFVWQVVAELPIQYLQFHGDETPAFCEQFGLPYIKAVPATSRETIIQAVNDYQQASALLLDTPSTVSRGGLGVSFDWKRVPSNIGKPLILAGGLSSLNVREAMSACSPYAVDVSSGIESSPGIKEYDKMSQFVRVVRGEE